MFKEKVAIYDLCNVRVTWSKASRSRKRSTAGISSGLDPGLMSWNNICWHMDSSSRIWPPACKRQSPPPGLVRTTPLLDFSSCLRLEAILSLMFCLRTASLVDSDKAFCSPGDNPLSFGDDDGSFSVLLVETWGRGCGIVRQNSEKNKIRTTHFQSYLRHQ